MDISVILERNPWRRNREEIRNDDHVREAFSKRHRIEYSFKEKGNLILIGPRRAGKTTYFKLLIYDLLINKKVNPEDVLYVSCEILRDHSDLIDVLRLIQAKYVFLDEITFVEGWEKAVKFALDQGILKGRTLLVTGSSTAFLRKETFPGRGIKTVHFMPMNFLRFSRTFASERLRKELESFTDVEELLSHLAEILGLFLKYMECGGFPKPAFQLMEEGRIREENYDEIYSWFRGDMLKLGRSEEIAKALVTRILETMTTPVAYHSLGNYIGVAHRIAREYIEEMVNLMYADLCYQTDPQKGIPIFRKEKKIYFTDPFILRSFEKRLMGNEVVDEPRMAEMIVFNTLKTSGKEVFLVRSNGETDFWIDGEAIEVKWRERIEGRDNATVLSKKDYNPKDSIFPLPLFILNFLKKNAKEGV